MLVDEITGEYTPFNNLVRNAEIPDQILDIVSYDDHLWVGTLEGLQDQYLYL